MKLFKNTSKSGNVYYSTTFYKKDLGGNILKKNLYVGFQKGCEPMDSDNYDLTIKAYVNGEEYDVLLDAYDSHGTTEGKLFFGKFNKKPETIIKPNGEEVTKEEYQNEKAMQLNINSDDLPFY